METNAINEYRAVVNDPTFRLTAERLLILCGIRVDLKGFNSLTDAVILHGTQMCKGFCHIYGIIAELRGLRPKTVMREISYVITRSSEVSNRLSELLGVPIAEMDIHNSMVIAYLGKLFENPDLTLYKAK